jgi:hypothetical protein
MSNGAKPRMLFLRFSRRDIPSFLKLHLEEQVLCLSQNFEVIVINDASCDYKQLCEMHEPDIAMFESGTYCGRRQVRNVSSCPSIPKIGFIYCDAYCPHRKSAICDMERWEISTFFTTSVSLGCYTPSIADRLFVWPNFVNPGLYRDYGFPKVIPVLFSGSQASHYPWRSKIDRIVSQRYPSLHSPHFGWHWTENRRPSAMSLLEGERYAQLLNSAWVAPTCGTIANEVVRKHFEIPACNTCLLTQETASLKAAGFVDLVNCVFADDGDVLDKLEWLFQRPDELDRITKAGKQLVDSLHTIRQRDQIFQWYSLHRTLGPGQRIVQRGPFLPLTIVEENSGVTNCHVISGGIDRVIMIQAEAELRSGNYQSAAKLFRRCLNYHQPDIPEAKFRLILCWLYQGNFKAALASVREHFPSHRLTSNRWFEPDPTEWAWFILVLLCCGKNREAALRADQFIALNNDELYRVRCLVRILSKQKTEFMDNTSRTGHRASIHQVPEFTIEEWLENIQRMLKACGQTQAANRLARASSKSQLRVVTESSSRKLQKYATDVGHKRNSTIDVNQQSTFAARQRHRRNTILNHYLAVSSRFNSFTQRITSRSLQRVRRLGGAVRKNSSRMAAYERAAIVHLLQKEEINSGVLIGAANGSWLSDAFMHGMLTNPNMPSAVCVNYNTLEFRKFHRRFIDDPNVEFRYVPNAGDRLFKPSETADVIAVNCSSLFKTVHCKTLRASLVLLNRIDDSAGHEIFRTLLSNKDYILAVHEPAQCDGYAVFRRVAVQSAAVA